MTDLTEQLGGRAVLDPVVTDFYERVRADGELAPMFDGVDVARLAAMQQDFLAAALTAGPAHSADALRDLHAGLGITPHHVDRFVELFLLTLEAHGVPSEVAVAVGHHLAMYADDVVGEPVEAG
jgi:hemoglobin